VAEGYCYKDRSFKNLKAIGLKNSLIVATKALPVQSLPKGQNTRRCVVEDYCYKDCLFTRFKAIGMKKNSLVVATVSSSKKLLKLVPSEPLSAFPDYTAILLTPTGGTGLGVSIRAQKNCHHGLH
jgi:hypothetical protein